MLGSWRFDREAIVHRARAAGVAALSVMVLVGLVGYASAPAGEAIAAELSLNSAQAGHEAIEGRALENGEAAIGTTVKVMKKTSHGLKLVAKTTVGKSGRFSILAKPGPYVVIIEHKSASKRISVKVKSRHSVFIDVTVKKGPGGGVIAPVIFNY